jgi:hypothetical protein
MSTRIDLKPPCESSVGAELIKTGQTTSYRTGDDGDIEAGRDVNFFTLPSNNPFGNTNRFTDELGTQTYTNNIVIDWSTYDGSEVLGYRRTPSTSFVIWNDAVDGALLVSIGTFTTGWRLTNIRELMNLMNFESGASWPYRIGYPPFNITVGDLWSSTTMYGITTNAFYYGNTGTSILYGGKANSFKYIPCRTFTVTGTILT